MSTYHYLSMHLSFDYLNRSCFMQGDTIDEILQAKAAANEVASAQATYSQPYTFAQIQAREADIKALSDLSRALDKKVTHLLLALHQGNYCVNW